MTTEFKVFTAIIVFFSLFVGTIIGYDIYTHPTDPAPAGTAAFKIAGTDGVRFQGDVGTLRESQHIEAATPVTLETPYRRADLVLANLSKVDAPTN